MNHIIVLDGTALLCGRCGRISYNPTDVSEHFCNACKVFLASPALTAQEHLLERLISTLVAQQPGIYAALAIFVRAGRTFDDIDDGYLKTALMPLGRDLYNTAYLTAEWLVQQRDAAQQGGAP